jgi:hypothetical protein
MPSRGNVGGGQRLLLPQSLLDRYVPLERIWELKVRVNSRDVFRGGFGVFYDLNSKTSALAYGGFGNSNSPVNGLSFPLAPNSFTIPPALIVRPLYDRALVARLESGATSSHSCDAAPLMTIMTMMTSMRPGG